jgi:hypothetical protein
VSLFTINLIPMQIALSRKNALEELKLLLEVGRKPAFDYPAFVIEIDFIDMFIHMTKWSPDLPDIIPFIETLIARALEESIVDLIEVLKLHKVDDNGIFEMASNKQLILTGVRKAYNRKIPGKAPKGLGTEPWKTYNNWVLAQLFWKAIVQSYDPSFKVRVIESDWSGSAIETFYDPVYRPLWAMKQAYAEAGSPSHGNSNDDIFMRAIAEWFLYLQKKGLPYKRSPQDFNLSALDNATR